MQIPSSKYAVARRFSRMFARWRINALEGKVMSFHESEFRKDFATCPKTEDVSGGAPSAPDEKGVGDSSEQRQRIVQLRQTNTESTKTEDKYRVIVDSIPALVWCTLPDGSNEFHNQRWHDYTGLTGEGDTA